MTNRVTQAPSGALADTLAGLDLAGLCAGELVDVVAEWERVASWVQARQLAVIAAFVSRREAAGDGEFVVEEIAPAIGLSKPAAAGRIALAQALEQRLAGTADALNRGLINLPKARAVVDATAVLDPAAAAAVERRVLPDAPEQTVGRLHAALARAVLAEDPDGAEIRHERAKRRRKVTLHPQTEGMTGLWAALAAEDAAAVYGAIDAHARQQPADDRSMDARRADALVALVTGADTTPLRPLVQITVPATTLLGDGETPGELAGYGPITATTARRIAEDPTGTWRRILTDPATGTILDVGHTTYRPTRGDDPARGHAGRHLSIPRLPTTRPPLRPGPCATLAGRPHRRQQFDRPMPAAPPAQAFRSMVGNYRPR